MKCRYLPWSFVAIVLAVACDSARTLPTAPTTSPSTATHSASVTSRAELASCSGTSTGFKPLSEPGLSPYPGVSLGLYPSGSNTMPSSHLSAGLQLGSGITPLNASGTPDPNGRYAMISIGMSNTGQEFTAFAAMSPSPNEKLEIINGAQGGMTAIRWADPGCPCWAELESRIKDEGLTKAQVVAAWIKHANGQPQGEWPTATLKLQNDMETALRNLAARYPNLRLAYLSSRIYGGYATSILNPEPYAYQGGFAVRGLIDRQLKGQLPYTGPSRVAPWIAWGPYMWADGLKPRSDGLTWSCSDFEQDGTHPSASGEQKVAQQLVDFFRTDPTAHDWFMAVHAGRSRNRLTN